MLEGAGNHMVSQMQMKSRSEATKSPAEKKGGQRRRFVSTELILILIIAGIVLAMSIFTDTFISSYNITNIFRQAAIIGIIAISSTFVIISGGIDLSVGSITGLSAMLAAVLMSSDRAGLPIWIAVGVSILVGSIVGLYHGFIIYDFKLPPFIATLGSMFVLRGVVKMVSDAQTISGLPSEFTDLARGDLFGIPWLVVIWLIVILVAAFVMKQTQFGRNIFVLGSSQEVARLSGIRMRLNVYGVYVVAAFLCALAGVMLTARLSSAIPTGGTGYELDAIAAAVIGGASLSGAKGSMLGTVLGTLLMALIVNAGVHLMIDPFVMEIVTGALLTVAVVIDQLRQRKK
jgi:ribose/xylose/arabinose/galactoside ABC-type transport system permease subunit